MMKITPDRVRPALVARAYRQRAGTCGMTPATARRWITVQEAAEYTHLHLSTVRDMIARGIIPAFRLCRLVRVDLQALKKHNVARTPAAKFKAGGRLC
jgi:excisionase family DNA binding protein